MPSARRAADHARIRARHAARGRAHLRGDPHRDLSIQVELGFHLCYGDLDAKHFIDPIDATKMVELANLITRHVSRPISWIHMPVPVDRTDDGFFRPLENLRLGSGTEMYLGLVHVQDGVEGTRRRIETARKYVPVFGIASECGISRGRDPQVALDFIKTYAGAAAAFV